MGKTMKDALDHGGQGNPTEEEPINTTDDSGPSGTSSEMTKNEDGTSMECGSEKMNREVCESSSDGMGVRVGRYNLRKRKNPVTNQSQDCWVEQEICPICGREFEAPKAMYGHMRIHSKGIGVRGSKEREPSVDEEEEEEEEEKPCEDEDEMNSEEEEPSEDEADVGSTSE